MKRRELLRRLGFGLTALGLGQVYAAQRTAAKPSSTIVVAEKDSPANLVRKAIKALGGMGKFVKRGSKVLIKPNIAFARP
ncbi:MAG: hypothetical protein ACK4I8_11645, partial [Armatimonadota bacterium]